MNFLIASLGVLGVASSGPLIAATLGATTVSALAGVVAITGLDMGTSPDAAG